MISYAWLALGSVVIFALVHLLADRARNWNFLVQSRFLSFGSGIAISYVFVDLLPKLGASDLVVKKAFEGIFPFMERHAFVAALLGFLTFFVVQRTSLSTNKERAFVFSMASYSLFNFFVGYAVVDKYDPEVQPLALFTLAMALHYFTNDYTLSESHGESYSRYGKWVLVASLFLGWLTGVAFTLPDAGVALISAFIGGGVIMNVIRHELPKDKPSSLPAFLLGALVYTVILLAKVGN